MECRVCEKLGASKHNTYGADRICTSCRGFFLRSVQSGLYEYFQCSANKSKQCVIESKLRQSCRKCRFAKCLEAGMKITYVLDKQERCRRMLSNSPQGSPRSICSSSISPDEIQEIANLHEIFVNDMMKFAIKYFAAHPAILWLNQSMCENTGRVFSYEEIQIMDTLDDYTFPATTMEFAKALGITSDNDLQLIARKSFIPMHAILTGIYSFVSSKISSHSLINKDTCNFSHNCAMIGGQEDLPPLVLRLLKENLPILTLSSMSLKP